MYFRIKIGAKKTNAVFLVSFHQLNSSSSPSNTANDADNFTSVQITDISEYNCDQGRTQGGHDPSEKGRNEYSVCQFIIDIS